MKYSKRRLGKELKEELEKGYDIVKISRWAFRIFFDRLSELDETESNILEELFRMEDDPQFELTKEEIYKILPEILIYHQIV
ncbi:MAG TPA: hypothetical protein PLC42_02030, partial [Parachlamydiaceae bacterium]|nr:hypothetical protein [Parachlamydiaceae bacterium]